jgi:hypothetical protein
MGSRPTHDDERPPIWRLRQPSRDRKEAFALAIFNQVFQQSRTLPYLGKSIPKQGQ